MASWPTLKAILHWVGGKLEVVEFVSSFVKIGVVAGRCKESLVLNDGAPIIGGSLRQLHSAGTGLPVCLSCMRQTCAVPPGWSL